MKPTDPAPSAPPPDDPPTEGLFFGEEVPEPAPPEHIGPFRVLNRIGRGGFASVYLAEQTGDVCRQVALKLLHPGVDSADVVQRFERERRMLGLMKHPDIATIFETGQAEDGRPYFAMEYVDGSPITKACDENGLSRKARVRLMARVCRAVQHAHGHRVIHRDLKPSNILVAPAAREGARETVKIIDFGVAKVTATELTGASELTQEGQFLGTLAYVSPEQIESAPDTVDTRADVYSLGAVLYELLTGQVPHSVDGQPLLVATKMISETEPTRPSKIDRSLRGDLEIILRKALARDRDQRYATAAELAAELERWLARQPISARPPTLGYQLACLASSHRTVAASLVGVAAIGVIALYSMVRSERLARESERLALDAERLARENEETALHAMRVMLESVVDPLNEEPDTADFRYRVLQKLVVDDFVGDRLGSSELALRYAHALNCLGDAARENSSREVRLEAIDIYRKAESVLRVAIRAFPDSPDLKAELSIALVKIGDRHGDQGEPAERLAYYERALEIDERLHEGWPSRRRFLSNLSWSYERMSAHTARLGKRALAAEYRRKRYTTAIRLYELFPESGDAQYNLACARGFEGIAARKAEDEAACGRHFEEAVRLSRALLDRWPNRRAYQRAWVNSMAHAAESLGRRGRFAEAKTRLAEVLPKARLYVKQGPNDVLSQIGAAAAFNMAQDVAMRSGNRPLEIAYCKEAIDILRDLLTRQSENVDARAILIDRLVCRAKLVDAGGNRDAALGDLRESLGIGEPLLEELPRTHLRFDSVSGNVAQARKLVASMNATAAGPSADVDALASRPDDAPAPAADKPAGSEKP